MLEKLAQMSQKGKMIKLKTMIQSKVETYFYSHTLYLCTNDYTHTINQ